MSTETISNQNENPSFLSLQYPTIIAVGGALMMMLARWQTNEFMTDGALMMVALACYLLASLFELTNIYAPSAMARSISLWTATLGVFFNLSSWLVRWIAGYEREMTMLREAGNPETPWFFRYIPFANLYDLSIAFAFGAGLATLMLIKRDKFRFIAAFALPLAALILVLARFIGNEFIDLPPVLDSYWRPIHVGVAALSYGVTLVCFAIAVVYLLKDRVKPESMGIWAGVFALGVIGSISKFSVFTEFTYRTGLFVPNTAGGKDISTPFRLDIPWTGEILAISGVLIVGMIISFLLYTYNDWKPGQGIGRYLLIGAFLLQIVAIGMWVNGVNNAENVYQRIQAQVKSDPTQMLAAGREIVSKRDLPPEQFKTITPEQFTSQAEGYLEAAGPKMFTSLKTNPVEFSGLITAITGLGFIILFGFRTEVLIKRLPDLDTLDGLMYKTACLAFAGLAMLLITGAIWANESWGRPWGFDSKETGALVAWLTYAAFLHTRISRGWKGRSSAYFAIIGFFFVIFTYLGVSYLLPGLHSYA